MRGVLANYRRTDQLRSALVERLRERLTTVREVDAAADAVQALAVRAALHRLSAQDRELLTLGAWDGLTTEQIAVAVG